MLRSVATAQTEANAGDRAAGCRQNPPPARNPKTEAMMMTHTVKPGDTLWAIAGVHLGDNLRWPEIYRLNRSAIVEEHARRNFRPADDEQDYWIFPGAVLVIPETP